MLLPVAFAIVPSLLVMIVSILALPAKRTIAISFAAGYFAVIPVLIIETVVAPAVDGLPTLPSAFIRAFLIAGLVEESVKSLLIRRRLRRLPETHRRRTFIAAAANTGLGFAAFENVLYGADSVSTGLLRSVTAVPLHAATAMIMAHLILSAPGTATPRLAKPLAVAVLIHGLYDFFLFLPSPAPWAVVPLLVVVAAVSIGIIRQARLADLTP
jgi:protease PrsW